MKDLINISEIDISIALINPEDPTDWGILYNGDGWKPINEATGMRFEERPLPLKIYPSLKN